MYLRTPICMSQDEAMRTVQTTEVTGYPATNRILDIQPNTQSGQIPDILRDCTRTLSQKKSSFCGIFHVVQHHVFLYISCYIEEIVLIEVGPFHRFLESLKKYLKNYCFKTFVLYSYFIKKGSKFALLSSMRSLAWVNK